MKQRIVKTLSLILSLTLSASVLSQTEETEKSCDFPEVGLHYTGALLRKNGALIGYEMTVRNKGAKDLNLEHPELTHEAADAIIFESQKEKNSRIQIDAEFLYQMHGPIEKQQKWFRGQLKRGESKKFAVNILDALRKDRVVREGYTYDIRILSALFFRAPGAEKDASIARFEEAKSRMNFSKCLEFTGVSANRSVQR